MGEMQFCRWEKCGNSSEAEALFSFVLVIFEMALFPEFDIISWTKITTAHSTMTYRINWPTTIHRILEAKECNVVILITHELL